MCTTPMIVHYFFFAVIIVPVEISLGYGKVCYLGRVHFLVWLKNTSIPKFLMLEFNCHRNFFKSYETYANRKYCIQVTNDFSSKNVRAVTKVFFWGGGSKLRWNIDIIGKCNCDIGFSIWFKIHSLNYMMLYRGWTRKLVIFTFNKQMIIYSVQSLLVIWFRAVSPDTHMCINFVTSPARYWVLW